MARAVISCFCQHLQFRLYFAIKASIFKLRPLLRFLCLINWFYRRYVSSMYNTSNESNRSNESIRSNRSNRLSRSKIPFFWNPQQLKNNYFSGNFYLLPEPGFPDQENRGGDLFNCFQRLQHVVSFETFYIISIECHVRVYHM